MKEETLFIKGRWRKATGPAIRKHNPADNSLYWEGAGASRSDALNAVAAARKAQPTWAALPLEQREAYLHRFAAALEEDRASVEAAISAEIGKPRWEARTETQAMIGKVKLSIQAYHSRCAEFTGGPAVTRFKPHGVALVFGPYNFPGHLPNGHIVPALLAGNTVVFKPSSQAPATAEATIRIWERAELPEGVLNLVQGSRDAGDALVNEADIDALFFTGSSQTGIHFLEKYARRPNVILALEMGGNNPLVVHEAADTEAAVALTIQSAYLTAGQRCTCARRLLVPVGAPGDAFLERLAERVRAIRVAAPHADPEPFMGPVVSLRAARDLLAGQHRLLQSGARALVEMRHLQPDTGLLSPGLLDITPIPANERQDEEHFGPLLQVMRCDSFEHALEEANNTAYGLSAGIITDNPDLYETFRNTVRAGIINWNQQLTGASGAAPFGGIGLSGNHRPSAWFAADYCSYPVASIEHATLKLPDTLPPGM